MRKGAKKKKKRKQKPKQDARCLNNSTQLELPHPVSSYLLVCSLREKSSKRECTRRGAEAKAVSIAPKSPSCGVVFFICGKYNKFLKFCLVLVGWLVSGT